MKKLGFIALGAAVLALGACGSNNSDTLNEAAVDNQAELNALAGNAAEDANAEMEALGNQQQQLEAEDNSSDDADGNLQTSPSEVEDNVQGM